MDVTPTAAPELIDEAGKDPTLDEFMRRDPADLSDEEFKGVVSLQRTARGQFILKQAKRQAKKEGVEEDE
jgi:hypothetical protein